MASVIEAMELFMVSQNNETSPFHIPEARTDLIERKHFDIPYANVSPAQKLDIYYLAEGAGPFPDQRSVQMAARLRAVLGSDKVTKEGFMAYDPILAERLRFILKEIPRLVEKKMFGGVGYILNGNMACGIVGNDLIVRVGQANYTEALNQAHTKVFDMTGKPMSGWIVVEAEGISTDVALRGWALQGIDFASSLPAK